MFSQRYERGSTLVTTNLPFDEWTEVFGSERLTGALLDRLTHHVNILEMNGDSYRLNVSGAGCPPEFQLDAGSKFQGRSSRMRDCGWPAAIFSSVFVSQA